MMPEPVEPMNVMHSYQKTATFLLRLVGFVLFLGGAMGLAWFAILSTKSTPPTATDDGPWPAVFWVITGVVVYALSKPLGKFLGSGLD